MTAPSNVPEASWLPNSQILRSRLTSFRILRTIVTVRAVDAAAKRLTPRMQAYCVRTLVMRKMIWLGTMTLVNTEPNIPGSCIAVLVIR